MSDYDLVIRNGSIIDGSGAPASAGDVAIRDGWIVEVGRVSGSGVEEIDAAGVIVTPGFIDIHTHYDGQAIWSDRLSPSSDHGVTTVIAGNCGIGFAPCRPGDRDALIALMEGVEDIPGAVSAAGLSWEWEDFPQYLDALDRTARDIDVGVLVPHSPVRVFVMGERAIRHEAATPEDRDAMARIAREALEAGALGIGTSKLAAHRSSSGELIPSYSAEVAEFGALAGVLRERGEGVFQMVTDVGYTSYEEQFPLLVEIARRAGRPLTYTHPQSHDWRRALELVEEANRRDDVDLKPQLLPRPVGMLLGLSVSAHPFCMTPSYLAIRDLPLPDRVARMRDPKIRAAILGETSGEAANPLIGMTRQFQKLFRTGEIINYEPSRECSMAANAAAEGRTPEEVTYDALLEDDGQALLLLTLGNYEEGSLDWMEPMLDSANVVLGLGDGGAHYGMICDASFSTFALTHWTRDREHGRRSVEEMVRRLTSEPAALFGLDDRGLIAPGRRAHINVIDYERLSLHKPHVVTDLPGGGTRLHQRADGYVATIVHGEVVLRGGEDTGKRPGKLVRGSQPATSRRAQAPAASEAH